MNFFTRTPIRSLAFLGLSLASLAAACSSDDDRPAPLGNGGTAGTAGTGGSGGSAGSAAGSSGSAGTGGAECVATPAFVQNCIDTGTSGCDEVTVCGCNACACLLAECVADEGCTEIRACAKEKRCEGVTCASPGVCQDVINKYGGITGPSAGLGLRITACLSDAECPALCPLDGGAGAGGSGGAGGTGGTSGSGGTAGTSTGGAAGSAGSGGTSGGSAGAATGGSSGATTGGTGGSAGTSGGAAGTGNE
ncbi:MAG: hypothetical protein H6718_02980 [Polyangiaceae bacterium]|nr:hypothetical protein [Polyangiaceae bacterium]